MKLLMSKGYLYLNANSHLIHKGQYQSPLIMPNSNTKYFIDSNLVYEHLMHLFNKRNEFIKNNLSTTHTPNKSILDF
jgi:hypothetical protein